MIPFLKQVAKAFYQAEGDHLYRNIFVFPNRRSALFFQRYLSGLSSHPLFSPQVTTINELFARFSSYKPADRIGMLFLLYQQYSELTQSEESFDDFLFWGEMLLNDFDDVDKYMVDARQLFTNVKELREIDERFDYLTAEQLEAIRRFWTHFGSEADSPNKARFIALWKLLYPLYTRFRESLSERGEAYEGMMFRDIALRLQAGERFDTDGYKVVFVGLNVLTQAERVLLKSLKRDQMADFYWDYQSPCVCDPYNKASYFVQENQTIFPSRYELEPAEAKEAPYIELIGVPSLVGQAKQTFHILEELQKKGAIDRKGNGINTAVVLPQEELLMPVLYSIPESIKSVNVTMGYPLNETPVASLIDALYDLQKQVRIQSGETAFYHRGVLSILSQRYVLATGEEETILHLAQEIKRNNRIYPLASELAVTPFLKKVFISLSDAQEAVNYLLDLLALIETSLPHAAQEEEQGLSLSALEREYLYQYFIAIKRMGELLKEGHVSMKLDTFFRLLKKMTASLTIPFTGEPLSGLQVMGVLETRALDFENLILLSVNEGIFPKRQPAGSFIPYNLRKGFGLSTHEHQESIYAYYFYRMIYRARRIYFLYDTRTEGMQTGEVSRYIRQLEYLYNFKIRSRQLTYDIATVQSPEIIIEKDLRIQKQLEAYLHPGKKSLSATALNCYIDCPLQFYFKYVEGLQEEEEISESIQANTFGSIVHAVMEKIYQPYLGKPIAANQIEDLIADEAQQTHLIEAAFAQYYFHSQRIKPLTGQNYLTAEVIRSYVQQVLRQDIAYAPFISKGSEMHLRYGFPVEDKHVNIKTILDRVDEKEEMIRILDYKTGKAVLSFKAMDDLFNRDQKERPKAVFQLFLYALMYGVHNPQSRIVPALYAFKELFASRFDWHLSYQQGIGASIPITDFSSFETSFSEQLTRLLSEIFNSEIPFTQTANLKSCVYCPFASICKR